MDKELVLYKDEDRIAHIILNRPEKRNALNFDMVTGLRNAFQKAADDNEAKVIVLSGKGKAFCSGADLASLEKLQHNTYDENLEDSRHLMELFSEIYNHPKVVIAKITGHAIAGGCGLASVCDFGFSVPQAKFGYSEVKIGFVPAIVMFFLLRKTGESQAKELLLSGKIISAEEAASFHLVNDVFPENEIDDSVNEFAKKLCQNNSGESMKLTKQLISQIQGLTESEALSLAAEMNARARATEDCKSGISAFLNKEPLQW